MLAKIGLILLLLLCFALAFVAGVMAPPELRGELAAAVERGVSGVEGAVADVAKGAGEGGAGGKSAAGGEGEGGAGAASGEEDPAVPSESLMVPSTAPEKSKFALRAGVFDFDGPARELEARLQALSYTTRVIPVTEVAGRSLVVAVGEYDDEASARADAFMLKKRAELGETPLAILLPPEKKKKE